MPRYSPLRSICACLALLLIPQIFPQAKSASPTSGGPLPGETLSYGIEWRLIYAGSARLSLVRSKSPDLESKLHVESAGLVSKLYKLDDNYSVEMGEHFCAATSLFDAVEGKRHHETKVTFDGAAHKASYLERDLLNNAVVKSAETEIPACVSDIVGGLYKLRTMQLEPGQSGELAISDGKKAVSARVEAQQREEIVTKAGKFKTVVYEAYIFNGVLFKRNARLQIWLTDDSRRLPVQLRAKMPFPIGTITFQLEKEERT